MRVQAAIALLLLPGAARAEIVLEVPTSAVEGDEVVLLASWEGEEIADFWTLQVDQLHGLDEADFAECEDEDASIHCTTIDDGTLLFTVRAFDAKGLLLEAVEARVEVVNRAPELLGLPETLEVYVGSSDALPLVVDDAAGDEPRLSLLQGPEWLSLAEQDGAWELRWTAADLDDLGDAWLLAQDDEGGRSDYALAVDLVEGDPGDGGGGSGDDDDEPVDGQGSEDWTGPALGCEGMPTYDCGTGPDCSGVGSCEPCCSSSMAMVFLPVGLLAWRRRQP